MSAANDNEYRLSWGEIIAGTIVFTSFYWGFLLLSIITGKPVEFYQ